MDKGLYRSLSQWPGPRTVEKGDKTKLTTSFNTALQAAMRCSTKPSGNIATRPSGNFKPAQDLRETSRTKHTWRLLQKSRAIVAGIASKQIRRQAAKALESPARQVAFVVSLIQTVWAR